MKHQDHQNCKHEKVKYCEKCLNVFCLRCKKEWDYEPCRLSHNSPFVYTYPITTYTKALDVYKTPDTSTPLPQPTIITCSNHIGEGDAN